MPHHVVIREHPRRGGTDATSFTQRGLDDIDKSRTIPRRLEKVEVEGLMQLVGSHVARAPTWHHPGFGNPDPRRAVFIENPPPNPEDVVHLVAVPERMVNDLVAQLLVDRLRAKVGE